MNEIFCEEFYILKRVAVWNLDIFPIQKKRGIFFSADITDRFINIWEVCVVGKTFKRTLSKWFLNNNGEKNQIKKTRNIQKIFD